MGNRLNAITLIIVCFVIFFIFTILFSTGKTKKNNIIKPKDSKENNMLSFTKQNKYKKAESKSERDSDNDHRIKSFPQSIYENKKNLDEIKNHMLIVKRKVNRMREMKDNLNEKE